MSKQKDESGNTYGMLRVLNYSHSLNGAWWTCLCECGETVRVKGATLRSGVKSCGCLSKKALENRSTHGMSRSREYSIWNSMRKRCRNPNQSHYEYYGGSGIDYCDKWETFEGFFEDMGKCPDGSYTLDRIDSTRGYCKENCEWRDRSWQMFNQKKRSTNTSGRTGIRKIPSGFIARIMVYGKERHLGVFDSFEEAVKAREDAEILYRGKSLDQ